MLKRGADRCRCAPSGRDRQLSWTSSINQRGSFVRKESRFRRWVTADGSSGFKAEAGRYHLYVSLACPWACRTLAVRKLKVRVVTCPLGGALPRRLTPRGKPVPRPSAIAPLPQGLEDAIDYTVVDWHLQEGGWRFTDKEPRCRPDPINHATYLREIYPGTQADYDGNITVPVLFDTVRASQHQPGPMRPRPHARHAGRGAGSA